MSKINEYVKNLTPSLYEKLKLAVELGKWDDGTPLNDQQKEHTLQLVIAYQNEFNDNPEHFSINKKGDIHMVPKKELKEQFSQMDDLSDTHKIDL